ncbi:MAG: ATP-binding cassette domain-containing protein [Candidatus Hodarchaeales archaeon]
MNMWKLIEKEESFLHFFKPAIIISLLFLLMINLISIPFILTDIYINIFTNDGIINNLFLLNLTNIIAGVIILRIFLPVFKIKNVNHSPLNGINALKTFLILSATIFCTFIVNIFFQILILIFDVEVYTGYRSILITENHTNDLFTIFLFFGLGLVIGPIVEELIYRRFTIPFLEKRGMSPFYAILASSLVFSLAHAANDLLNTNIASTIIHLSLVFIIGFACGLVYIITRNIIYPILIHGLINATDFIPYFLRLSSSNSQLMDYYNLLFASAFIIGLFVIGYGFLKYTEIPIYAKWVNILKQESKNNIIPGFFGYLLIFTLSTAGFTLITVSITEFLLTFTDKFITFTISGTIYLLMFLLVAVLLKRMKYETITKTFENLELGVESQQETLLKLKNDIAIKVEKLHKYYGEVKAVKDLSFEVRKGEIYGLLGPNGSGKTTTIKSILGLQVVNSGKINVSGYDPIISPEDVKRIVGYVAEDPVLYESMTVGELLDFVTSLRNLDPEKANKTTNKYLDALDAKQYYNKVIGTLSRGNKQKIQIICALLHQPKILIVDEPLSGLDAKSGLILKEIFQILIEEGGSIILSTHIMEQAQILCNRIGIINRGELVAEGTYEELRLKAKTSSESLEEIFLQLTDQDISTNGLIQSLRES